MNKEAMHPSGELMEELCTFSVLFDAENPIDNEWPSDFDCPYDSDNYDDQDNYFL